MNMRLVLKILYVVCFLMAIIPATHGEASWTIIFVGLALSCPIIDIATTICESEE